VLAARRARCSEPSEGGGKDRRTGNGRTGSELQAPKTRLARLAVPLIASCLHVLI
jgi:hypothetical protein